jgi:death-on-curing protein
VSDSPYLYLTASQIHELHDTTIKEHGGSNGLQGIRILDSCIQVAQNVAYFWEGDVFEQASAYAYCIIRNRPFKDGNKRTALLAALTFLEINGVMDHDYDEPLLLQAVLYLAGGKMNADLFAQFLRDAVSGTTGTWEDA